MNEAKQGRMLDEDAYLFHEGTHCRLYDRLGAHLSDNGSSCSFAVWAPNAVEVSVIGDFNGWEPASDPLELDPRTGVWHTRLTGVGKGAHYKYRVLSRFDGYEVDKTDPFAFFREVAPSSGAIVWDLGYDWKDGEWMSRREAANALDAPWSIYEVHLGSWRRGDGERHLSYAELAQELPDYVREMGFTHVEILPVMEHPYYPSWGYQVTGFFAPTSRFGTPQDFMGLVDSLHRAGLGVILDWVPSHFPSDAHGLGYFDGTYLYEHADPNKRIHPDWDSLEFNYGRGEVCSFLLSSADFWLERYHADAIRVDAVASMLYLDYSRSEGQWSPNREGGRENLEAVDFIRRFNQSSYERHPGIQTIAEESTAWPLVTRPPSAGGLGFGMKWDMGWMHDTLAYMKERPEHRSHHQEKITFRNMYAFSENFALPLSHDEVVHGKGSLLAKMPGDEAHQFANLRLLLAYMWGQPGKKLLFMGGEFGQRREWTHDEALEWFVLDHELHRGVQSWVRDLNCLYQETPALYDQDFAKEGFEWVNCRNTREGVFSFLRKGFDETKPLLAVYNFSSRVYRKFRVGAPKSGRWLERLNSDSEHYGGSGVGNLGEVVADDEAADGHAASLSLNIAPLTALFFTPAPAKQPTKAASRKRK